jgi:hypothetical protein
MVENVLMDNVFVVKIQPEENSQDLIVEKLNVLMIVTEMGFVLIHNVCVPLDLQENHVR